MDINITGPATGREILHVVAPEYSGAVNEPGVQETVDVMCLILPSGEIEKALIWRTSGRPELDRSAVQAVQEWRFAPISNEEVQAGIVRLSFDFSSDVSRE
jgi:TonB family protein